MAYDKDQKEFPLPTGDESNSQRKTSEFLPKYFRTPVNEKFLHSTLDQLLSPGSVEKLTAYYGRKSSKAHTTSDVYVPEVSTDRENYKLEPSTIVKDDLEQTVFHKDYIDYINQIKALGGNADDHSILNKQEFYAWAPHICWDKFYNFREYYWMPYGPLTISIAGQQQNITSTYTVEVKNNVDSYAYLFTPDGLTQNPNLKLYRGQTYIFDVSTAGLPFTIKTVRSLSDDYLYTNGVSAQKVESGLVAFQVPESAPDLLYYGASNDINVFGELRIHNISENTYINVDTDVIGKKTYTLTDGTELSNGMKVHFTGNVTPTKYASDDWYVEGVGTAIQLINEKDLEISSIYSQTFDVPFDTQKFDRVGFGTATTYAIAKDYVVINKGSLDKNPWSRYNRWTHKSVIESSAKVNQEIPSFDESLRAKRPIIEFEAGLKLHEYGTKAKDSIDLIDTATTDVMSTIEGSIGYYVDGILLVDGMRVLFTADTDLTVNNKIYTVKIITITSNGVATKQIALQEATDTTPNTNDVVLIKNGTKNIGKMYYYDGSKWKITQTKTKVNQSPLFDLFDSNGVSYANTTTYASTNFPGNKIFSYKEGTGTNDTELGFPLTYQSVTNMGDIVFNFNLINETFSYQTADTLTTIDTNSGLLRKYSDLATFKVISGWETADVKSSQRVIRQYDVSTQVNDFAVDVYERSGDINDLNVKVFVNHKIKRDSVDYTINRINGIAYIRFTKDLVAGDIVILKTRSATKKNAKGHYEFPKNLESNPLNNKVSTFTLGQVGDHVNSIVEEVPGFIGVSPGSNNLRDLGIISKYGRKFLQHSGLTNLAIYHLCNKENNIVKAIRYSQNEYSKFKRQFIEQAKNLGMDGTPANMVDEVLRRINKDKTKSMSFYFTDMVGSGGSKKTSITIGDPGNPYYALTNVFSLSELSDKSVLVYKNDVQLLHDTDYVFNSEGFIQIKTTLQKNDKLAIVEYDTTNGSYIPATPTKLGLYPKSIPSLYNDTTALTPINVIQGHDGSIEVAYNDYRDDILLELEKRIYNNLKVAYDQEVFGLHDFIPGHYRKTDYSLDAINKSLLVDFSNWLSFVGNIDYTENTYQETHGSNSLVFNYGSMSSYDNKPLLGWWRGIYKQAYDTDRPHSHPWEMLGFAEKPTWFDTVYGSAPYTSDNLILWQDLQDGAIREPNKNVVIKDNYKRPDLLKHIPVNSLGLLISPHNSNFSQEYVAHLTRDPFKFGDHAPVENAWRRSSDYPFAVMTSWILNQPSHAITVGWDRSRVIRNTAKQLVYKDTGSRIKLADLIFPNSIADENKVLTAGFVNYIYEYVETDLLTNYSNYRDNVKKIINQLAFKVRGYTKKDKFKLLLDSRTPLNTSNVFVPEENYDIILNTSSPIDVVTYSGIIIEKLAAGFTIKGYDKNSPTLKYFAPIKKQSDAVIRIGGVSASYVNWGENKRYDVGMIAKYGDDYYSTKDQHISSTTFEGSNFIKLQELPIEGGGSAYLRTNFESTVSEIAYGSLFRETQDVFDFILGYGKYLESLGFVFDEFNRDIGAVTNWQLSAKEFLYWTTQGWAEGSVISLSPLANKLKLKTNYCVGDNVFDNFYDYTLFKEDGTKLDKEFVRVVKQYNDYEIITKNTVNGIYYAKIPLVQKEHVVLIDNKTIFNDIIYDVESGYRQDRLKVLGYITANWTGGLNVPGFIYDQANVIEWSPYTDYVMSDIVKHKEFYYTAKSKIKGSAKFIDKDWDRLDNKPVADLFPNFEYKTNQFADFFDLDTDNFDSTQQRMAQHLIGYQKRQFLQNIINDDVSQYKFYQGYIQEKGTKNVLTKLFDALTSADKESIDFYEEWAIRKGHYGVSQGFDEVEYTLDDSKFRSNPQPFELTNTIDPLATDLVIRQKDSDVYLKPENYTHKPFPTKYESIPYLPTAGYVDPSDVKFIVAKYDDILNLDVAVLKQGHYVWVGNYKNDWEVFKFSNTQAKLSKIEKSGDLILVTTQNTANVTVGEIFAIRVGTATHILKANKVELNVITCDKKDGVSAVDPATGYVSQFKTSRIASITDVNSKIMDTGLQNNEKFWVDKNDNNKWSVLNNSFVYSSHQEISNPNNIANTEFGKVLASNDANNILVVGAPNDSDGRAFVYKRGGDNSTFNLFQVLESPPQDPALNKLDVYDAGAKFGSSVAISPDGKYILVGAPQASNVRTYYKGNYAVGTPYTIEDIVKYKEQLWKVVNPILPEDPSVDFTTFDSHVFAKESTYDSVTGNYTPLTQIILGNYIFTNATTDHLLIRASLDQYQGTKIGDKLQLAWNKWNTFVPPSGTAYEPFNGYNADVTNALQGEQTITEKVDEILSIDQTLNDLTVGDAIATDSADGTVAWVNKVGTQSLIYLKDVKGNFSATGDLLLGSINVGTYQRVFQEDINYLGGWWKISIGATVNNWPYISETNPYLVIYDIIRQGITRTALSYYNVLSATQNAVLPGVPRTSEIGILSYYKTYSIAGQPVFQGLVTDQRFFFRLGTAFNTKVAGNTINGWLNTIRDSNNTVFDPGVMGLNFSDINKELTISGIWNGYITVDAEADNLGNFYIPTVGSTVRDQTTMETAEVTFVKTIDFNKIQLFLKDATGAFKKGLDAGESSDIYLIGTPDRKIGTLRDARLDVNGQSGPYFVFDSGKTLISTTNTDIEVRHFDKEYWFYDEQTLDGIARSANIPGSTNKDYLQVYNISAGEGTQSGNVNEGAYSVYEIGTNNLFAHAGTFIVPDTKDNLKVGSKIEIRKVGDETVAYVGASGDLSSATPGKIYFVKRSTTKNWALSTNPLYMGVFDPALSYATGEYTIYNSELYKAKTNLVAGAWNSSYWEKQSAGTDYLGYIPNDSGITLEGDSTLNQSNLVMFGGQFDINSTGTILVTNLLYSTDAQKVAVYRLQEGHYTYSQTITSPEDSSPNINFANSVAISEDGSMLAIGSPLKDFANAVDAGVVYTYLQASGVYSLNQNLRSPDSENSENFGHQLGFDGNTLAVTSLKGDITVTTAFDTETTIFDTGATTFYKVMSDSGAVHLFERSGNTLLYAEKFVYTNDGTVEFGRNTLINDNHVYIGLPTLTLANSNKGTVVNFRKTKGKSSWMQTVEGADHVEVDKIKSVFIYNKKNNSVVANLDYIDPVLGKIAGTAEQELYYKTHYDPAIYNLGTSSVTVDTNNHWAEEQVGRLWWDLSTVRYYYPYQGNIIFNNNHWNKQFIGSSVDVYEWVETIYKPSVWTELASSNEGLSLGISGTPKYDDTVYVTRNTYDKIAQTTKPKYYYWVKNKQTTPDVEFRSLSSLAVSKLIDDPKGQGYKYITFFDSNKFALVNCESLLSNSDAILNVRYWTIENKELNIHNEYQVMTEGLSTSKPSSEIEKVWHNSLIGYDEQGNAVPDPNLSNKLKYGTLYKPRQSWFDNHQEALKQLVERVNSVLKLNLIVDKVDLTNLSKAETQPTTNTKLFDKTVDVVGDLAFVGTNTIKKAELLPTIVNGKITDVTILSKGKGYTTVPTFEISGDSGSGAVIELTIDALGQVDTAIVKVNGEGYTSNTKVVVRPYSVLVKSDAELGGKWAIYGYDTSLSTWSRTASQKYNTDLYWSYIDWYDIGYNQFTSIDYTVSQSYLLDSLSDEIGDIVKIENVGTGGWLLLEKIDNQLNVDYTVNYKTIGRENGTVAFKNTLYDFGSNTVGYASTSYDTVLYDRQPVQETRIILEALRDKIFINDLEIHYNELFFASLRYALSENKLTDWAFKTSFIKVKHNAGDLKQKATYKNDNLSNFEDYIKEVKPYKTNIREYVSSYEKVIPSSSVITDFDLPARYDDENQITPSSAKLVGTALTGIDTITSYPDKHWLENVGFKIVSFNIGEKGSGYITPPIVSITGGGGSGATAQAYISGGKVTSVIILKEGSGYLTAPTVTLQGGIKDVTTGIVAKVSAVLGKSLVKATHLTVKFDRTSGTYLITSLARTETFAGNNSVLDYYLKWPLDLRRNTIKVTVNSIESLSSEYTYTNKLDTTKDYNRYIGHIKFISPPANLHAIKIEYMIDASKLQAQDRINLFYTPTSGMPGKELAQILDGIDYGGVEVRSLGFDTASGWDTDSYMAGSWDTYDATFEDEILKMDGSTNSLTLSKVLEDGTVYNIYKNAIRIDDPNYGTGNTVTNKNAMMQSVTGDGSTMTITFDTVPTVAGDVIVVRKSTSDGSFLPDPETYDTLLAGGDLAYSSATGLKAEDIIVEGDDFVSPTTSKGPEEFVPGQVLDTLDIQVFDKGGESGSRISSYNHIGDGVTTNYPFSEYPQSSDAVFVSVGNVLQESNTYVVDYPNKLLKFNSAPILNSKINFVTMSNNGEKVLDFDTFTGDGSTLDYVTRATWIDNSINTFVRVNGLSVPYTILKSDSSYAVQDKVVVRFTDAPPADSVVNIVVYASASQTFSEVTEDNFTGDGSTASFQLSQTPFNQKPLSFNTVVRVGSEILNAGFTKTFTLDNNREYEFETWQEVPGSILPADVRAFLNGVELVQGQQYTWNSGTTSITLITGVGVPGDTLRVFAMNNGEYTLNETTGMITFSTAPAQGLTISVYQFSNHDVAKIERINYDVVARLTVTVGTDDYYMYKQLTNGRIKLRQLAEDAQYVWVTLNGELLAPSVDYKVTNDQMFVKINRSLATNDVIDIIHFTAPKFVSKFGYRQFKDMMNKTHYKRLGNTNKYQLATSLKWSDQDLELTDATGITEPSIANNLPGVLFIDGERLEYFVKVGNKLSQLRRGTYGTGVKNIHVVGEEVLDQGQFQTVPYKDEFLTEQYTADGSTNAITIGFTPKSANEFELFVGGKRMRKNDISIYDPTQGQDSPEADVTSPAEFTVDGISPVVTLATTPIAGTKIITIRKQGKKWQSGIKPLSQSDNDIARFLRQKELALPQ